MFYLTAAIIAVSLAAAADGLTTNQAIKRGAKEVDPVAEFLFGSATPTAKTVYVRGGLFIAAESALALTISHFHSHAALGIGIALCVQAGAHAMASLWNLRQN